MNRREFEFVSYNVLSDVKLFFVDIAFRNMHMHKEFELFRVFSGEVDVNCQNESYHLAEGDFALLNPRCAHEMHARSATPVRILPLQVSPSFWARSGSFSSAMTSSTAWAAATASGLPA